MKLNTLKAPMLAGDDKGNDFLLLTSANAQLDQVWLRAARISSFYERQFNPSGDYGVTVILMDCGTTYEVKEPVVVIAAMIWDMDIEVTSSKPGDN